MKPTEVKTNNKHRLVKWQSEKFYSHYAIDVVNTTQADQHKRSTASAAHFLTYPKAWGWAGTQTAPGMISPHHSERSTQSNWMSYQDMFERPSRLQTQTHHVEQQTRHQLISTTVTHSWSDLYPAPLGQNLQGGWVGAKILPGDQSFSPKWHRMIIISCMSDHMIDKRKLNSLQHVRVTPLYQTYLTDNMGPTHTMQSTWWTPLKLISTKGQQRAQHTFWPTQRHGGEQAHKQHQAWSAPITASAAHRAIECLIKICSSDLPGYKLKHTMLNNKQDINWSVQLSPRPSEKRTLFSERDPRTS